MTEAAEDKETSNNGIFLHVLLASLLIQALKQYIPTAYAGRIAYTHT